ncbi:MAG: PKD domain-containing protein, partial [Bryobacteraceae bacterium]
IQLGLFSSFKAVTFNQFENSGTLGQGALTFDYLFRYGRAGIFGAKGFLDNAVVNRVRTTRNILDETYLKIVDQVGASTALGLHKNVWFEGNVGFLKSRGGDNKPGGTLRFLFPVNNHFAFTVEGGFNETLITRDSTGRVVFGIQFGNFLSPREFKGLDSPAPVDVPRVRYEVLTRRIRTGNDAPVADAGPDLIGIAAGTVRLDGSASFDPDGDPITFQWTQTAGAAVTLSAPAAAVTTFTAVEGQSYGFRLTVRDSLGAQGLDGVIVTTRDIPRARINRFAAVPDRVVAGGASTLSWEVENADEVTITPGIGTVDRVRGARTVNPTETTTYTLTARNRAGDTTAIATVTVDRPGVRITRFTASAPVIIRGESSTLCWDTVDATSAEITGLGTVRTSGCVEVSPATTTSYTLIARNAFGETRAIVTVTVREGPDPVVVAFLATPDRLVAGQAATLSWKTEGATEVSISGGVGTVQPNGSTQVSPATTTTYTLTARNQFGEVTSTATVTVEPATRIVTFIASPNPVVSGQVTTVSWATENATAVQISGEIGTRPVSGQLILRPTADVTLTLIALGRLNQRVTQTLTITVSPPPITNRPPVASAGQSFSTFFRDVTLDGSASVDPDGDAITFQWVSVGGAATIADPTAVRPRVQLPATPGEYQFELTVTDSKGASTKTNVVVTLLPPPNAPVPGGPIR